MKEKIIFKDECYQIQGAVFEVYREMGSGLLVNFGSYPKASVIRLVL